MEAILDRTTAFTVNTGLFLVSHLMSIPFPCVRPARLVRLFRLKMSLDAIEFGSVPMTGATWFICAAKGKN